MRNHLTTPAGLLRRIRSIDRYPAGHPKLLTTPPGLLRRIRRAAVPAVAAGILVAGTACGSSTNQATGTKSTTSSTVHVPEPGSVNLGFAGSLQALVNHTIAASFTSATGYSFTGQGGGSAAVAQYIKSGEYSSTAFIAVGGAPIVALEPEFTRYYVQFAASPLVIAYNASGPFAGEMKKIASGKKPITDLFATMALNGFRLGRTDPNVDPQGQGFLLMMKLAATQLHIPVATLQGDLANSQLFAETSLESTLQAGQLDAASAYLPQAVQMHLPYISLPRTIDLGDPKEATTYATASITLSTPPGKVVSGIPLALDVTTIAQPGESPAQTAASQAFVAFTLSTVGLAIYRDAGYGILTPTLIGSSAAAPKSVVRMIHHFVNGSRT